MLRAKLEAVLQGSSQRIDEPEPTSTFFDPRLMVRHALNLVDPKNWPECEVQREDGTTVSIDIHSGSVAPVGIFDRRICRSGISLTCAQRRAEAGSGPAESKSEAAEAVRS